MGSSYISSTPDEPRRPAACEKLRDALGYALRFSARGKPHRHAIEDMARTAAGVLVDHLELSGFVVMKKPRLAPIRRQERRPTDRATAKLSKA